MDFLITIVVIIIILVIIMKLLENKQNNLYAKYNIHVTGQGFKHLGGHPYIKANQDVSIWVQNTNVVLITNKDRFEIPINNILDIQIQNNEQLTNRVTLTRLATLGVFALATPKTETTNNQYLYLKYLEKNIEIECIFKADPIFSHAGEILSTVNRLKLENA